VAAPVVTDPRVAVENEELPPELLEVVAGGEAGLAGPDDQGLDVLRGLGRLLRVPKTLGARELGCSSQSR
jgi:hypothetical protein